jgi:hypothetical protein
MKSQGNPGSIQFSEVKNGVALFKKIIHACKIKVMFGEISLKLRQTNWNVGRNNINVVVDELPSQITVYTCLTIDI